MDDFENKKINSTEPVMVKMDTLRKLHFCSEGIRRFCAVHGFQIKDFVTGIPSDIMRNTGDGNAIAAAEHAEREAKKWVEEKAADHTSQDININLE